ncbi:unnamed protein product [Paramecium sonneborni]|uniref:Tetratricopeptide repeat protein n=1 Tax=Paramecium sonneborni TaxID=65129 RepID=A0A8S1JS55_9CILI|nr:unnamed protein product [Paramecium sonneborni]
MELEGTRFQVITQLIKQKIIQLEFDNSDKKLMEIEKDRAEKDERIRKLTESLDLDERQEWIEYHRTQGTKYYQKQLYEKALIEYYLSILAFNNTSIWRSFGVQLINNIQLNLEYLKKPATMELLEFVLYIDPCNIKAYFKLGKCYSNNGNYQTALQNFQQGEKLCIQAQDKDNLQDFQKQISECRRYISQNRY